MSTNADLLAAADRAMGRRAYGEVIDLLNRCLGDSGGDPSIHLRLATARRAQGNVQGALDAVNDALTIEPLGFLALLMRASLMQALGRVREAARAYEIAVFHAPDPEQLAPSLRMELSRAQQHVADERARRRSEMAAQLAAFTDLDCYERRRLERFQTNMLRETRTYPSSPTEFAYPGLRTIEFFDPAEFSGIAELEAQTSIILAEFQNLVASTVAELVPYVQLSPGTPTAQWKHLNNSREWTAVHMLLRSKRIAANADLCPRTVAAVEALEMPAIRGRSPNLMFSILEPGGHIPPHVGISNVRVVLHLPLIVPQGCWFRVGAEIRNWEVGRALIFDDAIEHEARNTSDSLRVVLIVDLWRPELTILERQAITRLMEVPLN